MKKLSALLISLLMILSLFACGQGGNGTTYKGVSMDILGTSTPLDEVYENGKNELVLNDNGKGTWTLDGESIGCTWTLDGDALTVNVDGMDFTGTLIDDVVTLDFLGSDIIFAKEGASVDNAGSTDTEAETGTETDADAEPEDLERTTVEFNDVAITYTNASLVTDSNDKPAIAIYFTFDNQSDEDKDMLFSYYYTVTQGETELESAVVFESEDSFDTLAEDLYDDVDPGESKDLCMTYTLSDETTPVVVTFTDLFDDPIATWTITIA